MGPNGVTIVDLTSPADARDNIARTIAVLRAKRMSPPTRHTLGPRRVRAPRTTAHRQLPTHWTGTSNISGRGRPETVNLALARHTAPGQVDTGGIRPRIEGGNRARAAPTGYPRAAGEHRDAAVHSPVRPAVDHELVRVVEQHRHGIIVNGVGYYWICRKRLEAGPPENQRHTYLADLPPAQFEAALQNATTNPWPKIQ